MHTFHAVMAFLFGLVVGSFLNVVIYRLPRGENLSRPRSRCPGCGLLIAWYDNIPVLSWLLLRARCRKCKTGIPVRYPFVELLTGVLFLLAWQAFGADAGLVGVAILCLYLAALVSVSYIDLDWQIIPDRITKPGMLVFFALAPLNPLLDPTFFAGIKPALAMWLDSAAGIAAGTGMVFLIRLVFTPIFKKEAMGLGDLKLLGLIGAVVGPLQVVFTVALASLSGAIVGGLITLLGRLKPLPCTLDVAGPDGLEARFESLRFGGEDGVQFVLAGAPPVAVGADLDLTLRVSYQRVLEDDDAVFRLKGRVAKSVESGAAQKWYVETREVSEFDNHRLWIFKKSYTHIKFGPFLALGGAVTALYGDAVLWFLTAGYPQFARSLFS